MKALTVFVYPVLYVSGRSLICKITFHLKRSHVVVITTVKTNLPRLLTINGNQINIKVFAIPENMKKVFSKFKATDNGSE